MHKNSPYVVIAILWLFTFISMFLIPAFISSSFIRDYELNTFSSFYTAPVSKFDFSMGRFCGGLVISFMIISGSILGLMSAEFMPWVAPDRLGPFMMSTYIQAIVLFILPNLFIIGAICFALSTWTRSMLYTYVGIISVVVIHIIAGHIAQNLEYQLLSGFLDPLGGEAFSSITK
ncbi:MAG: hypothetical protein FP814_09990, partial [Desulfobacterium sp.]|nr:hypothetical protein [Desulfobacterium sp.]